MTDDALLALLPDDARAAVLELQRVPPELRRPPAIRALTAVAWPPHTEPLPAVSTLTPAQHALATLLLPYPHLGTWAFSMPSDMWARRRWLGIDAPGPLEQPAPPSIDASGAPLGRSLKEGSLETLLAALPVRDRFRALVEIGIGTWGFSNTNVDTELSTPAAFSWLIAHGDEGAAEAADFLCSIVDSADWFPLRGDVSVTVRGALCLAMVRGRGLAERHDRLLPLVTGWTAEILRALPVERRAPAVIAATKQNVLPWYVEPVLLEVLPIVPDARVLAALQAVQGKSRPLAASEKDLRALAKKHAAVAAIVGDLKAPAPARLTLTPRQLPPLDALDDLLRHQIGAQQLEDANGNPDLFERFDVVDGNNVLYEFVLFCGDDAAVFHKGTKTVVASFSQGGATGNTDPRLVADLGRALYEHRASHKKKATKKTATKKTATKKTATKKKAATRK